ncbi:MAG: hypothetical protein MJ007_03785, partial [Paludibacteraceae bacterium]|nr:hypothetical protein [Paludibacteraceae bacterium]
MNTSSVYCEIDSLKKSDFLNNLEDYANDKHINVYILDIPKTDLKNQNTYVHKNCFLILSIGYKVALVNAGASEEEYNNFCEDIDVIVNYLFSKYEYRTVLGRFSIWGKNLLEKCVISDTTEVKSFFEELKTNSE